MQVFPLMLALASGVLLLGAERFGGEWGWVGVVGGFVLLWESLVRTTSSGGRLVLVTFWAFVVSAGFTSFVAATEVGSWFPLSVTVDYTWLPLAAWLIVSGILAAGWLFLALLPWHRMLQWGVGGVAVVGAVSGIGCVLSAALYTVATGGHLSRLEVLVTPAMLAITHPWSFVVVRLAEVWGLVVVVGALSWSVVLLMRTGRYGWVGIASMAALLIGGSIVPPERLLVASPLPAHVATIALPPLRRLDALTFEPHHLLATVRAALLPVEDAALVVLPETIPYARLAAFAHQSGNPFSLSSSTWVISSEVRPGVEKPLRAEVVLARNASIVATRTKSVRAPVGERVPPIIHLLGWGDRSAAVISSVQGVEHEVAWPPTSFEVQHRRVGVWLCAEVFSPRAAHEAARGAQWVAALASFGWFPSGQYRRLYERTLRIRAAALGKTVVGASVGVGAYAIIVDGRGRVVARRQVFHGPALLFTDDVVAQTTAL